MACGPRNNLLWCEWEVLLILEEYGLLTESEFDAIIGCTSEVDAETLLSEYVKRAYFDYRKAAKFSHRLLVESHQNNGCMSGRNRWSTAIPTLTANKRSLNENRNTPQ
jgi:hypothetical protein